MKKNICYLCFYICLSYLC